MYIKRHIEKAVKMNSKIFASVLVTGARQVGKTTMLQEVYKNMPYVTLDDLQILQFAKDNTALFFNAYNPPVIVDEIQKEPNLFHYVKILADTTRQKGQVYMTGSQAFNLMKNVSESLAGRVGILEMMGLSYREIKGKEFYEPFLPTEDFLNLSKAYPSKLDYWEIIGNIQKGFYPFLYETELTENERKLFYNNYIKTYIERDVRQLSQITDETAFVKFITTIAAFTSQQLNYENIARIVGKDSGTIKNWLSILVASDLVYILEPYYENISKRMTKTPKIYFLDTGLACYLCGWNTAQQLANGAMNGAMFETYVVAEIIKSYRNAGIDLRMALSYYRDKDGNEIDLILEENGTLHPIEIKLTSSPNSYDISRFKLLEKSSKKVGEGGIICMSENSIYLNEKNRIIPVNLI